MVDMFTKFIPAESAADDGGVANSISGFVNYYDGFPMPMVHVMTGDFEAGTGPDGNYLMFVDDGTYNVTAMEDEAYPMYWGMNILDVVKLNRHLAVIEPFEDPYQLIAADVDMTGDLNVLDAVNMKESLAMIAPLPAGFMGFYDALFNITFDNWAVTPMSINISVPPSPTDIDFTGVRYGDVNASFFDMMAGPTTDEITGNIAISTISAAPGEEILVPIRYEGESTIHGYQLAVNYDSEKLEYIGFQQDGIIANEIDGVIHLVWSDIMNGVETGSALGSLRFNVLADEGESTELEISESVISDYSGDEILVSTEIGTVNVMSTGINHDDSILITEYKLHPSYPNPFNPSTTIAFDVPEIAVVNVKVYNALGRMVGELYSGRVPMGRYEMTFNASDMASGVYYVVMEAKNNKFVVPIQLVK
jgi:cohesin domain-containing protein/type IX secretion system substrate protein